MDLALAEKEYSSLKSSCYDSLIEVAGIVKEKARIEDMYMHASEEETAWLKFELEQWNKKLNEKRGEIRRIQKNFEKLNSECNNEIAKIVMSLYEIEKIKSNEITRSNMKAQLVEINEKLKQYNELLNKTVDYIKRINEVLSDCGDNQSSSIPPSNLGAKQMNMGYNSLNNSKDDVSRYPNNSCNYGGNDLLYQEQDGNGFQKIRK